MEKHVLISGYVLKSAFKDLSPRWMPSPDASATRVANVLDLFIFIAKNWTNRYCLQ